MKERDGMNETDDCDAKQCMMQRINNNENNLHWKNCNKIQNIKQIQCRKNDAKYVATLLMNQTYMKRIIRRNHATFYQWMHFNVFFYINLDLKTNMILIKHDPSGHPVTFKLVYSFI